MGGIGVVSEHLRHDRAADQRFQVGLERIGFVLVVDLIPRDVERERLGVFRLLSGVLDGFFRPMVEREVVDALVLGLVDVICEGIELAFHHGVMPAQDIGEPHDRRISWVLSRDWREFIGQRQPQLEFEISAHGALWV
jgi:hypothetical protein